MARWMTVAATFVAVVLAVTEVSAQGTAREPAGSAFASQELGLDRDLIEKACAEGRLSVYSLVFGGKSATTYPEFNKRFPCIAIDTFAASGGALAQRFLSEFRAGTPGADLVMNSSPTFGKQMIDGGLYARWTPPTARLIPDLWKAEGYWYAVGLTYMGVAWNTQEVTPDQRAWLDRMATWKDVLDAPFKGTTGMVDIRAGGSTQLSYYYLKTVLGPDAWSKLDALNPTMFNGINPLADRLAAGEFAFVPQATVDTAIAVRWSQGAPLQWKFPEPGLAVPYFLGIAANAPHPNAARLFLAWSLSSEGQSAWVTRSGLAPASEHAHDDRPYAQQPWYKLPKTVYRADWGAIEGDLRPLTAEFRRVFSQ